MVQRQPGLLADPHRADVDGVAVVAVGEASCRLMEDFYALGRGSTVSVPNCVPDVPLPPRAPRRDNAPLVVGSLGRLEELAAGVLLLYPR